MGKVTMATQNLDLGEETQIRPFTMNFGPQHPAAHGVLRLVLEMEGEIGRLAPGYSADIIAVAGNPLDDATVLENVDWVMARGRVIE